MTITQEERNAILAEDRRIKAQLAKAEPYLKNSHGIFESWEKGLKKDAAKPQSKSKYRDMYEPTMNYSKR